jgi:hypothetical protein
MPRNLTERERKILHKLLSGNPKLEELQKQAVDGLVTEWDDGTGTLWFEGKPTGNAPHGILAEAEFTDADGFEGHVLLHEASGRIVSLEFYKDKPGPIIQSPSAEDITVRWVEG